jgi:FixJ family two-component response regulator
LISIVDDEACVRESLSSLIRSVGYKTKEHASAEDFLRGAGGMRRVLDPRCSFAGDGGLELQRHLAETHVGRRLFYFRTRDGRAKVGDDERAVAFLHKPFSGESLLKAIRESIGGAEPG